MPTTTSRHPAAAAKVVVIETRHVRTDVEHFKSVVQSLTGKDSTLHAVVPEKPSIAPSRWRPPPVPEFQLVLQRQPPAENVFVKPTAMPAAAAASAEEFEPLDMWLHAAAGTNALEMLETSPYQTFAPHSFGSWQ